MFTNKCILVLLLTCCLAVLIAAQDVLETESVHSSSKFPRPKRSPQRGSVVLTGSKDEQGRQANLQYNHNPYTSPDGRGNAKRNFDHNRKVFAGGIQGSWRF